MTLLLKNGHLVDPVAARNGRFDLLIEGDRVIRVGRDLPADGARVFAVPDDWIVTPGLIDMHVHLREPGQEHKETIATGTAAAVAGGFTAVACMPNTDPVNDCASVTELILARAAQAGLARVYPIGAVSIGLRGEQLTEVGDLKAAGCVALSDDGRPVATALLMRRALEYASVFGLPIIEHAEDPSLKGDGVAHEGAVAGLLGLRGIPAAAESIMVERDIELAELTGGRVHIAHMSVRQSLRAVRAGKARGVSVTCEVTPHHLTLTDEALASHGGYDTNTKMNPPLREEADRVAMIDGLRDGFDRRDCDRPRAAPCRREGARIRPGAVWRRRARDRGVALFRLPRARRDDWRAAAGRAPVREPGAAPRRTRGNARRGRSRRRHAHRAECEHDGPGRVVPVEIEEHAVRGLDAERRRGGDDRRRPRGVPE